MKLKLTILFTFIILLSSQAQEKITALAAQNETYALFQEQNWKKLIEVGKLAIESNHDFYYLRLRVGIAYFQLNKYLLAEKHFNAAIGFYSGSELAQEYLYYCYLYTGKTEYAHLLNKDFPESLKKRINQKSIEFIFAEYGIKAASEDFRPIFEDANIDDAHHFQVGLKHDLFNKFSLFHAVTHFNQDSYQGSVKQLQYYISGNIPLGNSWLVTPSFHLLDTDFDGSTNFDIFSSREQTLVSSIKLTKYINIFELSGGVTFSNLDTADSSPVYFGNIFISPLGNNKLVTGTTQYINFNSHESTHYGSNYFVFYNPFRPVSLKISYFKNYDLFTNFIEDNGFFINNSLGITDYRITTQLNVKAHKNLSLYGIYQYEKKERFEGNLNYNMFLFGLSYVF